MPSVSANQAVDNVSAIEVSPLNVCVVNPDLYRSSGVTVVIQRIHSAVTSLGVRQLFLTCDAEKTNQDLSWVPANRHRVLPLMSSNPFVVVKALVAALAWMRRERVSVIHVFHRRLAAYFVLTSWFIDARVIYTGELTYSYNFLFWLVPFRTVVAISTSVLNNLRATTRFQSVALIGNPADFPLRLPPKPVETIAPRAVCVARLEPVKNHELLLDAWATLARTGVRRELWIVGEGSLRTELEQQTARLGIADLVRFCGFQRDVTALVSESLFAILVSHVEGLPTVIVEAAACGRATLLSNVDGSRDCLPSDGRLPNAVAPTDSTALAYTLGRWFADPDEVLREGERFFAFHNARHSTRVVGEQYASLYATEAADED